MGNEASFAVAQGELLRAARARRQMTLHDVEAVTRGEFKAASLSAYERGERAISVVRLLRLAAVYNTSLDEVLPPLPGTSIPTTAPASDGDRPAGSAELRVRLDVESLASTRGPGWDQLHNLVAAIQQRRRGRQGRYLLLRDEDVWIVAAIFGTTPGQVVAMLCSEGIAQPA
jgi:transcriptional regulator with XRE-family HTH domain